MGASGLGSCCRVCVAPELELARLCPKKAVGSPLWLQIPKGFFGGMFWAVQWGSEGFFFSVAVLEHRLCCTQTELRELPLLLLSAKAGCLEHPSDPGQ